MPVILASQQGTRFGWALKVGGANLTNKVPLEERAVRITESLGSPAQMEFTIEDPGGAISVTHGSYVQLNRTRIQPNGDIEAGFRYFGGHLLETTHSRLPGATGRKIVCRAIGLEAWLDWKYVPNYSSRVDVNGQTRQVFSDRAIVQEIITRYGGPLTAGPFVDATNTGMSVVGVQGVTLREALERVADVATVVSPESTRDFYVDHYGRLHYYSGSEGLTAPYRIADGSYTVDVKQTAGLVELWLMRESTGVSEDGVMGVSDMTLTGSPTRNSVGGIANEPWLAATTFNGSTQFGTMTGADLQPGDTFTLECWFKRASTGAIMALFSTGTNGYLLGFNGTDNILATKIDTGNHFVSDNTYTDNLWHHLVWTREPGDSDFYVDGQAITGTTTARTFASAGDDVFFASNQGASQFFSGRGQMPAIYNAKLSAATVLAHYNQAISLSPEGLEFSRTSGDRVHRVYVKGANDLGSGWVSVGENFAGTQRDDYFDEPDSTTVAKRNGYGRAFLRQHRRVDSIRYAVTHQFSGWALGQQVPITDSALGLDNDPQEIRELTTDFNLGNGLITYEMVLGDPRPATFHRGRRRRRRR